MDNANKWLTLAANLGVMIGITFLVVELKQDASIASAESFQQLQSEYSEWRTTVLTDKELAKLWRGYIAGDDWDQHLGEESLRLSFLLMNLFAIYENAFYSERYGVFGEIESKSIQERSCEQFNRVNKQGRSILFDFSTTEYIEYLETTC